MNSNSFDDRGVEKLGKHEELIRWSPFVHPPIKLMYTERRRETWYQRVQHMFLGLLRDMARRSSSKSEDRCIDNRGVVGDFSRANHGMGHGVSEYHFGDRFSNGSECVIERGCGWWPNRTIISKYKDLIAHSWWVVIQHCLQREKSSSWLDGELDNWPSFWRTDFYSCATGVDGFPSWRCSRGLISLEWCCKVFYL